MELLTSHGQLIMHPRKDVQFEMSITSLLPFFRNQAHSVATVKYLMQKVCDTVAHLNPGQVPVITADQPIYALAKQVQWQRPDKYGEDKYLVMFGGLHIEMAALRSLGSLFKDSGFFWHCTFISVSFKCH